MNEIWKPCIDDDGTRLTSRYGEYYVSNLGRVMSTNGKPKILTPQTNYLGYKYMNLTIDGKNVKPKLHRLVALAFLPNPENKTDVNHIDRDKSNNRLDNLEWTTHKENMRHSYDDIFSAHVVGSMKYRAHQKTLARKTSHIKIPNS